MLKPISKQRRITVYDIFRKYEDPNYPDRLAELILSDTYLHEIEKAQYLLGMWVDAYRNMEQIDKSTYYTVIPKLLKTLCSIFVQKRRGVHVITTMYFLHYKKWSELTDYIAKGLKKSDRNSLILLWRLCYNMIDNLKLSEKELFGLHLSEQFEEPLSMYKWSSHCEKIYLLQTIKFINSHFDYKVWVENGQRWTEIIKAIKEDEFRSEIAKKSIAEQQQASAEEQKEKSKEEMELQLYKFEYRQEQRNKEKLDVLQLTNKKQKPKIKSGMLKERAKIAQAKFLQKEQQYFKRKEINIFLVVKDEHEEKQIYRIEVLNEIISCRPLLLKICEDYWTQLTYDTVLEVCRRMEDLNYEVEIDKLMCKLLLNVLKYRKTADIIREKIGEEIIVKIIKNIEILETKSPFEHLEFSQIPTLVNEAFFNISPEQESMGVTIETIITKRIKSILEQANLGKEDVVNRSLMTVSCREDITLRKPIMNEIITFVINIKKKKIAFIETCIILVRILLSSSRSPDFKDVNLRGLAQALTEVPELTIYDGNPKVNELRKLCIQLMKIILPIIYVDYNQQSALIDPIIKWLEKVHNFFPVVFAPMIEIITILVSKYKDYFFSQPRSLQSVEKILSAINTNLNIEHKSENLFAFLECILKCYVVLGWDEPYHIYCEISPLVLEQEDLILQKQASIIFKREDEAKLKAKLKIEEEKQKEREKAMAIVSRKERMKESSFYETNQSSMTSDQKSRELQEKTIREEEEKMSTKMSIYFGEREKKWLKDLINNHEMWQDQYVMKCEFGCLEYSLLQTVSEAERLFYWPHKRPNQFIKEIILELDEDLLNLFQFLSELQAYQLLFLFATKIYFLSRDFFFVNSLKSYTYIQTKCFEILSVFFNKVEILFASSLFCSLLLPYANNRDQLKRVYDHLNQEQFLTDLFKGSNQFIGKEKCYYPWLINILMAYEATEEFRLNCPLVRESLISLGKNVGWWGNVEFLVNAEIEIDEKDEEENKKIIFEVFKTSYKKMVDTYFSRIQTEITNRIKQQELFASTSS